MIRRVIFYPVRKVAHSIGIEALRIEEEVADSDDRFARSVAWMARTALLSVDFVTKLTGGYDEQAGVVVQTPDEILTDLLSRDKDSIEG